MSTGGYEGATSLLSCITKGKRWPSHSSAAEKSFEICLSHKLGRKPAVSHSHIAAAGNNRRDVIDWEQTSHHQG